MRGMVNLRGEIERVRDMPRSGVNDTCLVGVCGPESMVVSVLLGRIGRMECRVLVWSSGDIDGCVCIGLGNGKAWQSVEESK
jgi:hypothetical protein